MNKKICLPFLMALVLVAFSSCNSKMGELSSDNFKTTPQPLVAVANQVPATINGTFPEKYFEKKSVVTVTPVMVWEGGEVKGTPFVYQGEKVTGNDKTISYKMGGNITMNTSFPYQEEMRKSELYLAFSVERKGKTYELPRVKVADGVVATSTLNNAKATQAAIAKDAFQRVTTEDKVAKILFLIQQSNIRNSELKSEELAAVKSAMKDATAAERQTVKELSITSTASPDGAYDLNEKLAENRENNTKKQLASIVKKEKIQAGEILGQFTAEDWDGFQELVEASSIQDKALILRVLSMYKDPAQREAEIKNLSAAFTQLADEILPKLRYSKITATIETTGKTDEEIAAAAQADAKSLTVEELLYAATIAKTNDEKKAIYKKCTEVYSSDFRGYNNLGKILFNEGKVDEAKALFAKASQLNSSASAVAVNQGLVAIQEGNLSDAEAAFGKAAGAPELNAALGTLYTERGEYDKAVASFGDTKSNNAAIAQMCAGDTNKAKNTLSSIEDKDAMTYYLMAVVGARTNNENMVASNLQTAVKMDTACAAKAKSDVEFAKFDLSNIIK